MTTKGELQIPFMFDDIQILDTDLATVYFDGKLGIISTKGTVDIVESGQENIIGHASAEGHPDLVVIQDPESGQERIVTKDEVEN